jgi:hypothetical protein
MTRSFVTFALGALALGGCADSPAGEADAASGDLTHCKAAQYPCGLYGTKPGMITENIVLSGFRDPHNACKAHQDKSMDLSQTRLLSFKDWYQGDPSCIGKKKKLLWVIVVIGSCTSCRTKIQALQGKYASGAIDERLSILNILYETDKLHEPVTEAFTKKWITYYGLTFPVAMDPGFKMGAYFSGDTTPYTMMIDLDNMKIVYGETGWDTTKIDLAIKALLK